MQKLFLTSEPNLNSFSTCSTLKLTMGAKISTLTAEVAELNNYLKKLETDVAISSSAVELIEIPTLFKDDVLKEKVCGIFYELCVEVGQREI